MKVSAIFVVAIMFVTVSYAQTNSFQSLSNEDFAKVLLKKHIQLVDVRTPAEFAEGHLENAINIDVNNPDFVNNIACLNKKYTVAVYCRSGKRSKKAAQILVDKGYKVYELNRGLLHWNEKQAVH